MFIFFKKTGKNRTEDDSGDDERIHRRSKVSSICINLPAAGLGQRPPSVHSSMTTDEGGFNEPSPKIKALSSGYDYEITDKTSASHPDVVSSSNVTYVDLAHRIQPEGIESDQTYDENESYKRKAENGTESIVYATIKPEIPMLPVKEMLYEKENILDDDTDQELTERGYVSPQKILDPTRPRLHSDDKDIEQLFNKKLPPEPTCGDSETEEEEEVVPTTIKAKKIPPPIPELYSPLDLQDMEFADASDSEGDVNKRNEEIIPDAMTHDEAERLLSSRWVFNFQLLRMLKIT